VLGAHAVVDGHDDEARLVGQLAAQHVVGVQVAHGPATAVVVDQCGRRTGSAGRPVQAQRDVAVRAVGGEVQHLGHVARFGLGGAAALQVEATRVLRAQRVGRRHTALHHQVEQGLGLGVEHVVSSCEPFLSDQCSGGLTGLCRAAIWRAASC